MRELHLEMAETDKSDKQNENDITAEDVRYVSDCQVSSDREVLIPDGYVGSTREKIALYKQLDSMQSEEQLTEFVEMLEDRFGRLPEQVKELLNIIRLRWLAIEWGFDKVLLKNGIMILYFVEDQHSSYYKSDKFKHILQYVTAHQQRYTFKQFKNRLQISVRSVADTEAGLAALKSITIV
jgi:transcription-repair coupling factor (superfamily II helicase)